MQQDTWVKKTIWDGCRPKHSFCLKNARVSASVAGLVIMYHLTGFLHAQEHTLSTLPLLHDMLHLMIRELCRKQPPETAQNTAGSS